jgi:hypothetical protein
VTTPLLVTGRFQPIHAGHLSMLRALACSTDEPVIVCVLRREPSSIFVADASPETDTFVRRSAEAYHEGANPLSDWKRMALVQLAIRHHSDLANVTAMLRERPDTSWKESLIGLPDERVWCIHVESPLDEAKLAFYRQMGENVRVLPVQRTLTATAIRARLRAGDRTLDWLPTGCEEFFSRYCLADILRSSE